jgi:nucleotide-binding universal stress UspA family protein
MIRTIFVPLEISNSDEVIIEYAIKLAKHFKSRLVFLKTFLTAEYAYPTSGMASIPATKDTLVLENKELHNEKLNYLKSVFPDLDSLDFELKVFSGTPLDLVNAEADESNADLIIIGTSGASGIGELFGTIAEKVTRESACPVLVIPDEFKFRPLRKVSLALDVDNVENRLHLDTLFHIANSFKSSLDVVNVSENLEKADIHHNIIYNRIKNEFDENVNYFTIRILLKEDEEKAIDEYIERNNIDMLAIVYREHGFFKRLFDPGLRKKLVFHSNIPLLVLK